MRGKSVGFLLLLFVFIFFSFQIWKLPAISISQVPLQREIDKSVLSFSSSTRIHSRQAVLVSVSSKKVLFQKRGEEKAYPASLTKMMTAILAIEHYNDLQKTVRIPAQLYNSLNQSGASMAGFLPNEKPKIIDLLYGTMLPSGADAAETLALSVSGSENAFVSMMNRKAAEIGMKHTHFTNPSGLHDPNHYTTARDMSLLLLYALKNPVFHQIFTTHSYQISPTNFHPNGMIVQSTLFQKMGNSSINGGAIIGGKTGYTDEAGLCLASLAQIDGQTYNLITLGAPGDHNTIQYDIEDAKLIYNQFE
ncbi:serine hydrolase [Sporolactobacillus sp. STCC-11]|uniref:D-alanyl-D-alanine carboxypeptidase family protein n=1 Tax=Sporolactobacillus caesalpiniae TaxID=3230362 RepID=UPI003391DCD7